jgi:hypothetical protein
MPISYIIDEARCRVQATCSGSITVEDILGHHEAAVREGFLGYRELIDTCSVTPPYLSGTDVWRAAMSVRNALKQQEFGPRAVLVASNVVYGMARIFTSILSDDFPMRVFRDRATAVAWLESLPETRAGNGWRRIEASAG